MLLCCCSCFSKYWFSWLAVIPLPRGKIVAGGWSLTNRPNIVTPPLLVMNAIVVHASGKFRFVFDLI